MSTARKMILDTELQQPVETCPAHKRLVDVLLSLDGRISRVEIFLLLNILLSVGAVGKEQLWKLLGVVFGA